MNERIDIDRDREARARRVIDPTLGALAGLTQALEANAATQQAVIRRLENLREQRQSGVNWRDILRTEEPPGTMQMVSEMLSCLSMASGVFRRELATSLREEGITLPDIARMFGVTHQRVSNLLRPKRPQGNSDGFSRRRATGQGRGDEGEWGESGRARVVPPNPLQLGPT